MPRVTETAPPRLLEVDVEMLSFDPKVGVLNLETDDGMIELAINRNVAALLAGTLIDFLAADESDPEKGPTLTYAEAPAVLPVGRKRKGVSDDC